MYHLLQDQLQQLSPRVLSESQQQAWPLKKNQSFGQTVNLNFTKSYILVSEQAAKTKTVHADVLWLGYSKVQGKTSRVVCHHKGQLLYGSTEKRIRGVFQKGIMS